MSCPTCNKSLLTSATKWKSGSGKPPPKREPEKPAPVKKGRAK